MASFASELLGRFKETGSRLSPAQRWLAALLGVALVLAVGVAYYLNRPDWVVLVSQADPKDVAAVVARLEELKVPFRPSGDGYTILVPAKERDAAKFAMVQAGLPKGTGIGMEIFDEPKFGATEFDRKVNYLRARQGELERTLLRNSDLEYARVHLDIPEQSVFIRAQQPVKAGVLLQTRPGRKLSPEQVVGIANFLSSSVQGLTAENVTVVDQSGRLLSSGTPDVGTGQGLDSEQLKHQDDMQRRAERGVQTLLEPVFGPGNVVARVSLELNMDARKVETVTVGGATPKSTTTEREASTGKPATGSQLTQPDQTGAPPVYQGQSPASAEDLWKSRTTTAYEVSNSKEVTIIPPGQVKRISVGIAINRTDLSPDEIKKVKGMVAAATGADASAIEVAAMQFKQEVPANLAAQPVKPLEPRTLAIGLGAAAAVMLVGFFVTRRRKDDDALQEQPLLMDLPKLEPSGTMLDVALGMAGATGGGGPMAEPLGGAVPSVHGPFPGSAPMTPDMGHFAMQGQDPLLPLSAASAQQKLEVVMASRPKRQLVIGGQPVDEQLIGMIDDLIDNHPETCAEMIREWLKGGNP